MISYSILREKEDAMLATRMLTGTVIDLGGHKGSSYYARIQSELPIEVVNLDSREPGTHKQSSGADHVFDLEKPFPLQDASYQNVLCVNVLEHIYNYRNLLQESFRILKVGGRMYISVPFFFNIHGSPNDYFRYTESALIRMLGDAGFTQIHVVVLGEGPCSVMFQTFGGSLPTMPLKLLVKKVAVTIDRGLSRISKKYAGITNRVPLGYFVEATKK